MQLSCTINGTSTVSEIEPDLMLADFLRAQGYLSVRQGCDTGNCGLCTVWVDGRPVLSCATLAARMQGRNITTIEGVADPAREVARYLADEGADQCGFCNPGLVMSVLAMAGEPDTPDDDAVRHYLAGNLCRCTGYASQARGIRNYLDSGASEP